VEPRLIWLWRIVRPIAVSDGSTETEPQVIIGQKHPRPNWFWPIVAPRLASLDTVRHTDKVKIIRPRFRRQALAGQPGP
jgi:hypothetical protein